MSDRSYEFLIRTMTENYQLGKVDGASGVPQDPEAIVLATNSDTVNVLGHLSAEDEAAMTLHLVGKVTIEGSSVILDMFGEPTSDPFIFQGKKGEEQIIFPGLLAQLADIL